MKSLKIIVLCGGTGIRLGTESNYIPKAMVKLGHKPLVWHVMKRYALAGHKEFILALGSKGDLIRNYFTEYRKYANDIRVNLETGLIEDITSHREGDWRVSLIDTGESAMTGARIARCKRYVVDDVFMVSYADCLADIDLDKLLDFHKKSQKIATITGVTPPYREGEFIVKDNIATGIYDAKESSKDKLSRLFNGGYMVFNRKIFSYLNSFTECKLETGVFLRLIQDKQLAIYPHLGFWRWLDTERDYLYLKDLVDKNNLYWLQK